MNATARARRLPGVGAGTWIAAAGVLAVAAAAAGSRYPGLFRDGFNSDEAVYSGQAAAIAGFQPYQQLFGVFRAHPLLVHVLVAIGYELTGVNDWLPRVICAGFGVGLSVACLGLGWVARGRLCGLAAGLVAALAPYPVTVSRQVLLDGPAAAFTGLFMLLAALWLRSRDGRWLQVAAASAGLAFLSKETAILLLPAAVLFLLLAPHPPLRPWDLPLAAATYVAVVAAYPLSSLLAGGGRTTGGFLVWQLSRPPNHSGDFYLTVAAGLGYAILALLAVGLVAAVRERHPMDVLAVAVIGCNLAFFQAWPTKGYSYLAPLVPPVAYLGGRGLTLATRVAARAGRRLRPRNEAGWRLAGGCAALGLLVAGLLTAGGGVVPQQALAGSGAPAGPVPAAGMLAETGGLPAARPVGAWARANTPEGAVFLTIGPSFGNVIQFYGGRRSLALSVGENPLRRNPTYEPIPNPDASIRRQQVQYLVYDAYSAARSPFFARKLLGYARKFGGVAVYSLPAGADGSTAIVVVYQVHP